jgi:uncharacterized protein YciI
MKRFIVHYKKAKETLKKNGLTRLHNEYIEDLKRQSKFLYFAEYFDEKRALLILQSGSYDDAKTIVKDDPYIKCFYYQHFEINKMISDTDESMNLFTDKNIINYTNEAI